MVDEMFHKNRGYKERKVNRRNSIRGTQGVTKPSPTVDNSKVQINSDNAISLLQNLKTKYNGICNPHGFINDLRVALGIPTSRGASKYGTVTIPIKEGVLECSICITNHNATAENYVTHNSNYPYYLRLLIRNQFQPNRFHPHPNVKLDEYVYYGKKMEQVDNPLCQIIDSLIGFLQTGEYKDTTGVAFLNHSPQADGITQDNNKENINCNRNMNKNKIRLTESQLHKVIKESVKQVLSELDWKTKYSYMKKRRKQIDALCAQANEIVKNKVGHREINQDEYSQYWIEAMNDLVKDPKNKKIINATQLNDDDINRAIAKQYGIGYADYRYGLVGDNQVAPLQGMRTIGQYISNGRCRKVYPDDRDPRIKIDVDDPNPNPKMVQAYNDIKSMRHKTTSDFSTLDFDEY